MTDIHIHLHIDTAANPPQVAVTPVERVADQQADFDRGEQQYTAGYYRGVADVTVKTHELSNYDRDTLSGFARTALGIVLPDNHLDTVYSFLRALANHQRRYWGIEPIPSPDDGDKEDAAETAVIQRVEG